MAETSLLFFCMVLAAEQKFDATYFLCEAHKLSTFQNGKLTNSVILKKEIICRLKLKFVRMKDKKNSISYFTLKTR